MGYPFDVSHEKSSSITKRRPKLSIREEKLRLKSDNLIVLKGKECAEALESTQTLYSKAGMIRHLLLVHRRTQRLKYGQQGLQRLNSSRRTGIPLISSQNRVL